MAWNTVSLCLHFHTKDLELLILFGGFFAYFDLTNLNKSSWATVVIPGGIPFLQERDSHGMVSLSMEILLAVRGRKIRRMVTFPKLLVLKDLYCESIFTKNYIKKVIKMKNKPDPALLRTSYLPNEIKKGHQTLMKLSLNTFIINS
jgi:hypothetical protein